jgi:hypothetical protein
VGEKPKITSLYQLSYLLRVGVADPVIDLQGVGSYPHFDSMSYAVTLFVEGKQRVSNSLVLSGCKPD